MPDIEFFQLSDVGCVREENEDAIASWPHEDGMLFAVADGLGGHNAGQVASSLALEVFAREMDRAPGSWPIAKRLRRAIQEANLNIHQKGITVPELRQMGTTFTVSALIGGTLITAHVGDCRLYRMRDGQLTQLTKDHTWVWEQVEYGILSPEEARTHPRRHMITRCLGPNLLVSIDLLQSDLKPGDVLAQCSDGIHSLLPDADISEVLRAQPPQAACQTLVELARARGGDDNISIQVATITDCPVPPSRSWWPFRR